MSGEALVRHYVADERVTEVIATHCRRSPPFSDARLRWYCCDIGDEAPVAGLAECAGVRWRG